MCKIIWEAKYNYKKFISKWGIAFFITFGYCKNSTSNYKNISKRINNSIYFYNLHNDLNKDTKLLNEDLNYLYYGLSLISNKIAENSSYHNDTLILLKDITYSICFFQQEVLTACIIEYCAKMFSFNIPEIKITFDKNKYIYDFSNFL